MVADTPLLLLLLCASIGIMAVREAFGPRLFALYPVAAGADQALAPARRVPVRSGRRLGSRGRALTAV